ncbi:hypothetical protein L208DRAFT_1458179 [Tricholoma matsutake]|nr:hypothetical protein L208DRAFT_1458179 [Tricholoma matsutake 945]
MPPSACVLWIVVLAFSASFQLSLAAPAFQPGHQSLHSYTMDARAEYMPTMKPTTSEDLDSTDPSESVPDGKLPPVAEVFKMMAEQSEISFPATSQTVNSPAAPVALSTSTTFAGAQNTESPTRTPQIIGPGIGIADPEARPPGNDAAQPVDNDDHPLPTPIHKFILVGSAMGGIIVFTLLMFLFFKHRTFNAYRKGKNAVQTDAKVSPSYETCKEGELDFSSDSLDSPKFPPPSSTYQPTERQAALLIPPGARVLSRVMNITPNFPRSKFSITSSDFTYSSRSSKNSFRTSMPPVPIVGEETPSELSALLPPSEFFSMPSSPDLRRSLSSRHSRNHSAPIFGHDVSSQAFLASSPGRIRAGDHRKSKSISGLVYTVGRPRSVSASLHRRSTSSKFSQYKGTPPINGFLSAPDS